MKNVVFIFADQMHRFALGCMQNSDIYTPNLDKMAEGGTIFTNSYSNCPICSPFRANLFTGLYAHQMGNFHNECRVPESWMSLADQFNCAGFETSFIGKWHLGDKGNVPIPEKYRVGFKHFLGYQCYNGFKENVVFFDEQDHPHTYADHRTDVTTRLAIEQLDKLKEKPFFLCIGYQAPHYPVEPNEKFEKMYQGKKIMHRPNVSDAPFDPYIPTQSPRSPRPITKCPNYQRYGNDLDEYLRLYYGMVSQIDEGVGKILSALEQLGLSDNTAVIFTADHGDMQGSHGLKGKKLPYEESSGIPLIIKVPKENQPKKCFIPVSGVDYYPTCLELAGISPHKGDILLDGIQKRKLELPGQSLTKLILGQQNTKQESTLHRPAFSEMRFWRMIRDGDLKLVVEGIFNKPTMLFDLANDPYELNNLVKDAQYKPTIKILRQKIKIWQKLPKIRS